MDDIKTGVQTLYELEIKVSDENVDSRGKLVENSIEVKEMGRYIASSDKYKAEFTTAESLEIEPIDKNILEDGKIYRFPKLTLPRDKMELVNKKYNSRVVRDKDKADLAVVSDKFLQSICHHSWNHVSYESKASFIKNLLNDAFLSNEEITRMEEWLEDVNDDDVFSMRRSYYYGSSTVPGQLRDWADAQSGRKPALFNGSSNSGYTYYVPIEAVDIYQWLYDNKDKLCMDNDLGDIATEDSVTLTEETYQSISAMVNSEDQENKAVGLEMMANCNAETSHTFLALLFFFHNEEMKYCKNWNYVNFKSLRSRFDSYILGSNWGHAYPYDNMIKRLVEDDSLTEFAVQVIAKEMFKNVLKRTFGVDETEGVFSIDPTVLILKPEYKDKVIKKADLQLEDLPF